MSTNSNKKARVLRMLAAAVVAAFAVLAVGCGDHVSILAVRAPGQGPPQ